MLSEQWSPISLILAPMKDELYFSEPECWILDSVVGSPQVGDVAYMADICQVWLLGMARSGKIKKGNLEKMQHFPAQLLLLRV